MEAKKKIRWLFILAVSQVAPAKKHRPRRQRQFKIAGFLTRIHLQQFCVSPLPYTPPVVPPLPSV